MSISILWFRLDLRLADNPALTAAVKRGAVVPVFIWAPEEEGKWAPGAASRWWLHQSLRELDASLRKLGSRLIIRRGPSLEVLRELMKQTRADKVLWNRRYEPALNARDAKIKATLSAENFNSALLFEPWEIQNSSKKPFQVFTPYWKSVVANAGRIGSAGASPSRLPAPKSWPASLSLEELKLEPKIGWAKGFCEVWEPGEAGAQRQLRRFIKQAMAEYAVGRDRPAMTGTSRLSPHLHFGEIGPRQIWEAVQKNLSQAGWVYLREIGWREFAHHLLFHFPHTTEKPLRPEFARFPWKKETAALKAWQKGMTGFPLVDAGMRELWTTGWMHNRVRMVVASFLVKDLLIPWQSGAEWFWDTLVDADLANNTLGWQWTAGCGADASPFFRVFNPTLQADKFDPAHEYIKRWVPEAGTPAYPKPIVDHAAARTRALLALAKIKSGTLPT